MRHPPTSRITEGEMCGAPVPGGCPDRGPFRAVGDSFRRIFGRRNSTNHVDATERADESSESAIAEPAQEEPDR